jgi:hypothetical protein
MTLPEIPETLILLFFHGDAREEFAALDRGFQYIPHRNVSGFFRYELDRIAMWDDILARAFIKPAQSLFHDTEIHSPLCHVLIDVFHQSNAQHSLKAAHARIEPEVGEVKFIHGVA